MEKNETIVLITEDRSFQKEFSLVLPRDVRIVKQPGTVRNAVVFIDIDTIKPTVIRELSEDHFVIAVTGLKRTETIMEATTYGAYETLHRPVLEGAVHLLLQEIRDLKREIGNAISVKISSLVPTCAIVGHSPVIMAACKKLARLSMVEAPVLITGETGTGKELIAESIAQLSSRFGKPFVVVNCAAVPENLIESELFGFEKGSFTGAAAAKEGILKIADGGCVFLDEVGELPLSIQGKLLRFIQTQTFYPLGGIREVHVNVRVLSATNRDLSAMVREGKFREDLYHRLKVTAIHAPSLRERKEDILPLVHFFINRYRHTAFRPIHGITRAFLKKMTAYDWPGNIRELENAIRSALALCKMNYLTTFDIRELGGHSRQSEVRLLSEDFSEAVVPFLKDGLRRKDRNLYEKIHDDLDKAVFDYVLSYTRENQSEAARLLGISRLTLRKKIHSDRR